MANIAEMQKMLDAIEVLKERVEALEAVVSEPDKPAEPVHDSVPTEEELARYRGKPGRKPDHIKRALDAEQAAQAA